MFKIKVVNLKGSDEVSCENEVSILLASRSTKIELTHRCGGHARCGTCLVTIRQGLEHLSPAGASEMKVLKTLKAKDNQRLACQAWAKSDVECFQG